MRILYLLTRDLEGTGALLLREHEREHQVEVVDLRGERDWAPVVAAIESADRVISW